MEEGDKAEHSGHAAPFVGCEPFAQGNAGDFAHNVVHGRPLRLDANGLQEGKINGEFTRKRVEITTAQAALGLQCVNLELLGGL